MKRALPPLRYHVLRQLDDGPQRRRDVAAALPERAPERVHACLKNALDAHLVVRFDVDDDAGTWWALTPTGVAYLDVTEAELEAGATLRAARGCAA